MSAFQTNGLTSSYRRVVCRNIVNALNSMCKVIANTGRLMGTIRLGAQEQEKELDKKHAEKKRQENLRLQQEEVSLQCMV